VKPVFREWECIPNPASLCKITLLNTCALPQQGPASQETGGDHEWWRSALFWSLWKPTSLCMVEAWGVTHLTFED
jgi:hypothetical protein